MFGSFLTVFCLKMGTKQNKHSHSAVESKQYTVTGVKIVLKIFVPGKEILVCYLKTTPCTKFQANRIKTKKLGLSAFLPKQDDVIKTS